MACAAAPGTLAELPASHSAAAVCEKPRTGYRSTKQQQSDMLELRRSTWSLDPADLLLFTLLLLYAVKYCSELLF
jgi:hypothetical protein